MSEHDHYCVICSTVSTSHPAPFWALDRFFINPCCKGCGCQTYESALANATPEEKAIEAESR